MLDLITLWQLCGYNYAQGPKSLKELLVADPAT